MKLLYSPASPYVRKVSVVALETGLDRKIERIQTWTTPVAPDANVASRNPLSKVPALITEAGDVLYDSRVICEYLDSLHGGAKMFPSAGKARWKALQLQALGDGLLDAALLLRYEGWLRPEDKRWGDWQKGQQGKVDAGLAAIETEAGSFGDRIDIGPITIACALGYLDFRFGDMNWRNSHPKTANWFARISERGSFRSTVPVNPT
jgi:glutathione S-transferase